VDYQSASPVVFYLRITNVSPNKIVKQIRKRQQICTKEWTHCDIKNNVL